MRNTFVIVSLFLCTWMNAQNMAVQQANPPAVLLNIRSVNQWVKNDNRWILNKDRNNFSHNPQWSRTKQEAMQMVERGEALQVPNQLKQPFATHTETAAPNSREHLRKKREPIPKASRLSTHIPGKYKHFRSRSGRKVKQHNSSVASIWKNVRALPCCNW